jgi:hypothetical protein
MEKLGSGELKTIHSGDIEIRDASTGQRVKEAKSLHRETKTISLDLYRNESSLVLPKDSVAKRSVVQENVLRGLSIDCDKVDIVLKDHGHDEKIGSVVFKKVILK